MILSDLSHLVIVKKKKHLIKEIVYVAALIDFRMNFDFDLIFIQINYASGKIRLQIFLKAIFSF